MIAVGEVQSGLFFSSRKSFGISLPVTSEFMNLLRSKLPNDLRDSAGNAYVFGRLFDSGYHHIGTHQSDIGGTGVVDVTKMTKKQAREIGQHEYWDKEIKNYGSKKAMDQVQSHVSKDILFIGSNKFGLGSEVYVHYNAKHQIDGLILNAGYFDFDDDE